MLNTQFACTKGHKMYFTALGSNANDIFKCLIAPKNLTSIIQRLHPLTPSPIWSRNGRIANRNASRLKWIGSMTDIIHKFVCHRDFIECRCGAQHDDPRHYLVLQSGFYYGNIRCDNTSESSLGRPTSLLRLLLRPNAAIASAMS